MTRPGFPRWLRVPAAAVACAGAAWGQFIGPVQPAEPPDPTLNRPESARRLVRFFDFEPHFDDPARAEVHPVPRSWDIAQDGGPFGAHTGFPPWNLAELDFNLGCHGTGSVRLPTRGGSTALRLRHGVIPVFPETEYLVSAAITTRDLAHARAAIVARYLDRADAPITDSEVRSELVTTEPGQWRIVTAALPGIYADAAYLQIDLEVLQPEEFRAPELGPHQVWPQDFAGAAWFDDVAVVQVPRVEITTGAPANILVGAARPTIKIAIRDLAGEPLTGTLTLQDAVGRTIDAETRPLADGRAGWNWQPRVDRFGWYRASLELTTKKRRVGGTYVDFAWLPPAQSPPTPSDRSRFGLIVTDLPAEFRPKLTSIVTAAGTGAVTLPIWPRGLTAENAPELAQGLVPVVNALRLENQRLSFSLARLPDALVAATHAEREDPCAAFAADPKVWSPYLLPLIDKYGQSVQRWQVGAVGDLIATRRAAADRLGALKAFLTRLVPGPTIAVPWPAELAGGSPAAAPSEAVVLLPYEIGPAAVPDLIGAWRDRPWPASITVIPEPLPEPQFSRQDSAISLVKRTVEFWSTLSPADAPRPLDESIALRQPWSWPTPGHEQLMPAAELAAFASLVQRLDGRRIVGSLPAGKGITCYILAPASAGRTGALVAWSDSSEQPDPEIQAYLGAGAVSVVDLWGNATPVKPVASAAAMPPMGRGRPTKPAVALTHHIPLSGEPVFIENVEVELAQLVASFRLDPGAAQSTGGDHELSVVLANPFKTRIDGRLRILEPGGLSGDADARERSWRITPRMLSFSIGPGDTARLPITASFSAAEEAGAKPFVAEAEFTADREYGPIRLQTEFEVRLDSIDLQLSYRRAPTPDGADLIVEAQATNRTTTPATLELSAFAPGYPRAKASVADLAPGATVTRRFAFPGGAAKLKGQRIAVAAQNSDTQARINRSVLIE